MRCSCVVEFKRADLMHSHPSTHLDWQTHSKGFGTGDHARRAIVKQLIFIRELVDDDSKTDCRLAIATWLKRMHGMKQHPLLPGKGRPRCNVFGSNSSVSLKRNVCFMVFEKVLKSLSTIIKSTHFSFGNSTIWKVVDWIYFIYFCRFRVSGLSSSGRSEPCNAINLCNFFGHLYFNAMIGKI